MQTVLVLDFGAQYAQLIARRIRDIGIFCHIVPSASTWEQLREYNPSALVLSGGPCSVYENGAPMVDNKIFSSGVPILGICYGFQLIAKHFGGEVQSTDLRTYGASLVELLSEHSSSGLFNDTPTEQIVWMSHGDRVVKPPADFAVSAVSKTGVVCAIQNMEKKIWGIQWHPEAAHTHHGTQHLKNFLCKCAEIVPDWKSEDIVLAQVESIRAKVGTDLALCALSGGVDSAVAAAIVHAAIGDRLICVFVDHGLLREGEREQVERDFAKAIGVRLIVLDESERFLRALKGVIDPEDKRKIIGREFVRVFEDTAQKLSAEMGNIPWLVQGTLYPDLVESGSGTAANIKSHHNVGGLPSDMKFGLIEPLRELFKDEVRKIGANLKVPECIVRRQPFPGPGLAIRIVGEVTRERLSIVRQADAIVRHELTAAGEDEKIWQCPVVLLANVKSVGIQGDGRTYGYPIVLRPVVSEDAMSADWARLDYNLLTKISNRITNEVPEVNRVVLDITSKPPGTIEWE